MGRSLEGTFDPVTERAAAILRDFKQLGLTTGEDIRRVGQALIELAQALTPLDAYVRRSDQVRAEKSDVELAGAARSLYLLRRRRDAHLPHGLFGEPAWDILLDLFVATVAGKRISTKSLCAAADVPTSTALRWLGILEARGLIVRWTPPDDQRLTTVEMTPSCYKAMRECLAEWLVASERDMQKMRSDIVASRDETTVGGRVKFESR